MGTYTTNYNLFMPSVGETGWGELVNENFTTIDTTIKSLSNRITAVESEVSGALSCTSVTASGKITGNGGIVGTTGTFSGAITGTRFNGVTIKSSVYTVTPTNTVLLSDIGACGMSGDDRTSPILPFNIYGYTGSVKFKNNGSSTASVYYLHDKMGGTQVLSTNITAGATVSISFTNIHYLKAYAPDSYDIAMYGFTLT